MSAYGRCMPSSGSTSMSAPAAKLNNKSLWIDCALTQEIFIIS